MTDALVGDLLAGASRQFAEAGIESAARDARLLLASAMGTEPMRLNLHRNDPVCDAAATAFRGMIAARLERRPVSQIIGRRHFWGRDFEVTGDVLDPRPETEALVACALEAGPAARVLDLGTGSGAILLTLLAEWPLARGIGTDISSAALAVARRNGRRLGLKERADFVQADWATGLEGRFDLIVSNPPYIPAGDIADLAPEVRLWEPRQALTAGPDGLEAYRRIAGQVEERLAPGGRLLVEVGAGQAEAVAAILRGCGDGTVSLHRDLDRRPRVVSLC